MNPRTKRALARLLALFLAVGGGDALVQFLVTDPPSYDYRHLAGALLAALVVAVEKWLVAPAPEPEPEPAAPGAAVVEAPR